MTHKADPTHIRRFEQMEESYNRLLAALRNARQELEAAKSEAHRLQDYQQSGLWLQDFEADERGELPAQLRRGVLSEDGLHNALTEFDHLSNF